MSYLGIDIGGTKTLLATFDNLGNIVAQKKIKTNENYNIFISEVEKNVANLSTNTNIACGLATPGIVDREGGPIESFGANIAWKDKTITSDISKVIGGIPVIIENDAKAAGLAEAGLLLEQYETVFYLTVSTGIGGALIKNGQLVEEFRNKEVGSKKFEFEGKVQTWENFASGKAIFERYGKLASDITDEKQWQEIGERIGYGLAICCDIMQPHAVVFGGGAGQFADKFKTYVAEYLDKHLESSIKRPTLLAAKYADNSAIHGCFVLIKQKGLVQ